VDDEEIHLFIVCASKGIMIRNISDHGHINWHIPSSEGFFKRVYFLQDTVVQVFRQMTMYQRITEVACLMQVDTDSMRNSH
jgi:dihydrofolate reductase